MMRFITKERAGEILKKYKIKADLFNWCEEYKDFIRDCVNLCVTSEVEYILKKSYEDSETPLSYDDLDLFDKDKAIEKIIYSLENEKDEEELKGLFDETNEENNLKIKKIGDYKVFLNSLSIEEIKELYLDKFELDSCEVEAEVYEWWVISDPLLYRLEKRGEIILNGNYWGRCTTGQHISLDYVCIHAFIDLLEDRII